MSSAYGLNKESVVSPTLRTRSLPASLCAALALVALVGQGHAQGQSIGDEPFAMSGQGNVTLGNAPIRLSHRTRGYGEETSETAFGAHGAIPLDYGVLMIDGQLRTGNSDRDISTNLGLGYRWMNEELFTGNPQILGASVWYDGEDTKLDNYFNQVGVSLERLGERIDFRVNGNIAIGDTHLGKNTVVGNDAIFSGNLLALQTLTGADVPLRVVDFEAAPRIFDYNVWAYGGGYQMDGDGISEFGWKSGVRGYIYNDLVLDVGVTDDDQFGTNTSVQVIWTPGRTSPDVTRWVHSIEDRMREQVYRNMYVATAQRTVVGAQALTNAAGEDIRVVHVDSNKPAGGDGTIEHPLNTITAVQGNSQVGDIILVHSTSTFNDQTATLQDAQRFLGEGDRNLDGIPDVHTVVTTQKGTIELPESSPGAGALAIPVIDNTGFVRDAVVLKGATTDASTLAEIEVSNMSIVGGRSGIVTFDGPDAGTIGDGVADVNINRMDFSNTTGNAIDLTPLTETLANSTTRSRFTPTIDNVTFTGIGGNDINIDAGTTETTIVETIAISKVTSDDGNGIGINLQEGNRAATISNFDWDGGTTGDGALRIANNAAQGVVTLNGTNTITGGQNTAKGTTGYAIRLEDAKAANVVSGTTITDTGGDSIQVTGGSAGLNFTGHISQTTNAAVVNVANAHTGTLIFNSLAGQTEVINATNGIGLLFDNADGSYTFNDTVTLNNTVVGGDAGIDVLNGSAGTFVFDDADISNPVGSAIKIDSSSAVFTHSGTIGTNSTTAPAIQISDNTGGSNTFTATSTLTATAGQGIAITDNTGGTTLFSGAVSLTNSAGSAANDDDAVMVTGNSAGSTTFANLTIANATGAGIRFANNSGTATFAQNGGSITGNGATDNLVVISANTGAGNTFTETAAITGSGSGGIAVTNNTGGASNAFTGTVGITNAVGDAVAVTGNSAGATSFTTLNITNPVGGSAVDFSNNSGTASFGQTAGAITTNSAAAPAINITGNSGGSATFAAGTSITATAGQGINSQNNTGGTFAFNGPVNLTTTTNNGVTIANNSGGSTSFNNLDITTTTGQGLTATASAAHTLTVSGTGNTITTTTGTGLRLNTIGVGGAGVNFASVSTNGAINGIVLSDVTGGAVNIGNGAAAGAGGSILNSTQTAISVNNVASALFNQMVITGTAAGFDGIAIDHTNAATSTVTVTNNQITGGQNGIDYNRSASATSRLIANNNSISGTANESIEVDVAGSGQSNLTFDNNTTTAGNDSALAINVAGGTNKTTNLLVNANNFANNSTGAQTATIINAGTGPLNATVSNNTFNNSAASPGQAVRIASTGGASSVRLDLNANNAVSGNATDYSLEQLAGTFTVLDLATVNARNTGTIVTTGTITNDAGPIPQPQ